MRLTFSAEYLNLLLLLSGLLLLMFLYSKKKRKKRAIKFGNYETLKRVSGRSFLKTSNLLILTRILAIASLMIAISNPALVEEVRSPESSFVIALDSSSSMFTPDIEPSRFQAAKETSRGFIEDTESDTEIGFVTYSGEIENTVEPTESHEDLLQSIESAGIGETGGTNLADAITTSTSLLIDKGGGKVILVTDGEDTGEDSLNESIEFAKSQNTSVYAIGIGSSNSSRDFETIDGENISGVRFPNIDREELVHISNSTGGNASFVSNRSGLRDAFLEIGTQTRETELTTWLVLFAAALLVLEWILRTTRWEVIP